MPRGPTLEHFDLFREVKGCFSAKLEIKLRSEGRRVNRKVGGNEHCPVEEWAQLLKGLRNTTQCGAGPFSQAS